MSHEFEIAGPQLDAGMPDLGAEDARQAIEDTLFTMATTPGAQEREFMGIQAPSSPDYHTALLRADEYPGRGVIVPVTRASIALSNDRQSWKYFRGTETSHSSNYKSSEAIVCTGGIVRAAAYRYDGYGSRLIEQRVELDSSREQDREVIGSALGALSMKLGIYRADLAQFHALKPADFDHNYNAFYAAKTKVSPRRHFRYNIVNPDQVLHDRESTTV